jgi:hypothetical protein
MLFHKDLTTQKVAQAFMDSTDFSQTFLDIFGTPDESANDAGRIMRAMRIFNQALSNADVYRLVRKLRHVLIYKKVMEHVDVESIRQRGTYFKEISVAPI